MTKIVFLHNGIRALGGGTNLALTLSDVLKGMGNKVVVVDQAAPNLPLSDSRRDFYWGKEMYLASDQYWGLSSRPVHFSDLRDVGKYYNLKHLRHSDYRLVEMPSTHHGREGYPPISEELSAVLDDADLVATDSEILTRLPEANLAWSNLLYVHFPIGIMPSEDRPWKTVLCNSKFTKGVLASKWEIENSDVCYPPIYTEFFDYRVPMNDRKYDVILFSRLVGYKMGLFRQLRKRLPNLTFAIAGSAYGWRPPPGVDVFENATAEEVTRLLADSRFYAHLRGLNDPMDTEHFGISIASAVASGCMAFVPSHPSGALEIPSVVSCDSVDSMALKIQSALNGIEEVEGERETRALSVSGFDPATREDEFKAILEISR